MESPKNIDLISNFPPSYPWYKRVGSNITYHLSRIPISPRKNKLEKRDIKAIKSVIQNGDILLVGNLSHISGLVIPGIVTHAIGYIGKGRCIHAFAKGVGYISLSKVYRSYDTLVLIRPRWKSEEQLSIYRRFLIEKIGFPYDFFFGLDRESVESYFCSELINEGLLEADYATGLVSLRQSKNDLEKALDDVYTGNRALTPEGMLGGNFDVIVFSHNIEEKKGKYLLKTGENHK